MQSATTGTHPSQQTSQVDCQCSLASQPTKKRREKKERPPKLHHLKTRSRGLCVIPPAEAPASAPTDSHPIPCSRSHLQIETPQEPKSQEDNESGQSDHGASVRKGFEDPREQTNRDSKSKEPSTAKNANACSQTLSQRIPKATRIPIVGGKKSVIPPDLPIEIY